MKESKKKSGESCEVSKKQKKHKKEKKSKKDKEKTKKQKKNTSDKDAVREKSTSRNKSKDIGRNVSVISEKERNYESSFSIPEDKDVSVTNKTNGELQSSHSLSDKILKKKDNPVSRRHHRRKGGVDEKDDSSDEDSIEIISEEKHDVVMLSDTESILDDSDETLRKRLNASASLARLKSSGRIEDIALPSNDGWNVNRSSVLNSETLFSFAKSTSTSTTLDNTQIDVSEIPVPGVINSQVSKFPTNPVTDDSPNADVLQPLVLEPSQKAVDDPAISSQIDSNQNGKKVKKFAIKISKESTAIILSGLKIGTQDDQKELENNNSDIQNSQENKWLDAEKMASSQTKEWDLEEISKNKQRITRSTSKTKELKGESENRSCEESSKRSRTRSAERSQRKVKDDSSDESKIKSNERSNGKSLERSNRRYRKRSRKRSRSSKRSRERSSKRSRLTRKQSRDRSSKRSPYRSVKKSRNTSKQRSRDRSGKRSRDRSGRRSRDRSVKKSRKRSRDRSSKRSRDKSSKRSRDKSTKRSRDRSTKRSRDRSTKRSRDRSTKRSRDRSTKRSRDRSTKRSRDRSTKRSRDRSTKRSRDRQTRRSRDTSRPRRRSQERSKKRSVDSERKSEEDVTSSWRIDKARLRQIAIKNALQHVQPVAVATVPPVVMKPDDAPLIKTGGKSLEELTEFCKKISEVEIDDIQGLLSGATQYVDEEEMPFIPARTNKDMRSGPIKSVMTLQKKLAQAAQMSSLFPVSSGNEHKNDQQPGQPDSMLDSMRSSSELDLSASKADDVKQAPSGKPSFVRDELAATRWVTPQEIPGQFTGSTGVQKLSYQELSGSYQAWAKKDTLNKAPPVASGIGKLLLQRMGWKEGEGLGKNNEGMKVPLAIDIKTDRKGLVAPEEDPDRIRKLAIEKAMAQQAMMRQAVMQQAMLRQAAMMRHQLQTNPQGTSRPLLQMPPLLPLRMPSARPPLLPMPPTSNVNPGFLDLNSKHPVSFLTEICSKRHWDPPEFILLEESGPSHNKYFRFKIIVNGAEYISPNSSLQKKTAKMEAATACLQKLGLVPL